MPSSVVVRDHEHAHARHGHGLALEEGFKALGCPAQILWIKYIWVLPRLSVCKVPSKAELDGEDLNRLVGCLPLVVSPHVVNVGVVVG